MSSSVAPLFPQTSIFIPAFWASARSQTLTEEEADARYLRFPTGQGTESIPNLIVSGSSTLGAVSASTISQSGTYTNTNPTTTAKKITIANAVPSITITDGTNSNVLSPLLIGGANTTTNGNFIIKTDSSLTLNDSAPNAVITTLGNGAIVINDTTNSKSSTLAQDNLSIQNTLATTYYSSTGFYSTDGSIYCNNTNGFIIASTTTTASSTLNLTDFNMVQSGVNNTDTILLQNTGGTNPTINLLTTDAATNNSAECAFSTSGGGFTYVNHSISTAKYLRFTNPAGGSSTIEHTDLINNAPLVIITDQDLQMTIGSGKNLIMTNLPTSNSGLPAGALWNNSGVLNIV